MRVKKSCRKKSRIVRKSENIEAESGVEQQPQEQLSARLEFQTAPETISTTMVNPEIEKTKIVEAVVSSEAQVPQSLLTPDASEGHSQEGIQSISIENSDIVVLRDEHVKDMNVDVIQGAHGRKRCLEDNSESKENEETSVLSTDALYNNIVLLKKKSIDLEARIQYLEEKLIATSQDARVIEYLVDIENQSNAVSTNQTIVHDSDLNNALTHLNMNLSDLIKYKKKTPTATARSLIKLKYPNPDPVKGISQASNDIIEGIINYALYCHPNAGVPTTQLRRAINNYFSLATYNNKIKSNNVNNESSNDSKYED